MPFTALQSAFDALYPAGLQWYWRADFFNEISDAAIEVHRQVRRAAAERPLDHAPLPDRRRGQPGARRTRRRSPTGAAAGPASSSASTPTRPTPRPSRSGPATTGPTLHPTSAGGAYVNFLMDEGQDRVRAAYGGNYDRLAQVKRRYDPDNTFHVNQNIRPAGSGA